MSAVDWDRIIAKAERTLRLMGVEPSPPGSPLPPRKFIFTPEAMELLAMTAPQVSGLAALVEKASGLKDRVNAVADKFVGNINRVEEALGQTEVLSNDLGKVADELQSAVGLHGNIPPSDSQG